MERIATVAEAQEELRQEFALFDDWRERIEHILELGKELPPLEAELKTPENKVHGCQSQVWLASELRDGRLYLAAASDAAIVSGLVAMLLRIYSGRTPEEVLAADAARFLKELDLIGNLSANRGNGIASMVARIRALAAGARA